jgi:hypothetical protein
MGLGCGTDIQPDDSSSADETGLTTGVRALKDDDIDKFHFRVETCNGDFVEEATAPLEDMTLPGGIEDFENKPFDADSAHRFTDQYFTLDAGCYEVTATPLDEKDDRVESCTEVTGQATVQDGQTREIVLISQCENTPRGGLDIISAINHPPEIDSVKYTPSKFVSCPDSVQICVEATDPDGDPMRTEWELLSGDPPVTDPEVTVSETIDGTLRECISFEPGSGAWTFGFTVYDQLHQGGELIDFETYLGQQGDPHESRDSFQFPLYGEGECEVPGPDVDIPDTSEPERDAAQPEPDVAEPSPDVGPRDVSMPEPDAAEPDVAEPSPDVGPRDISMPEPDAAEPDTAEPDVAEPDAGELVGCTRTRGYWSTHHPDANAPGRIRNWPDPYSPDTKLCGETWLSILNSNASGGMWYILAAQWIAAKLNVAEGASITPEVDQALADGEAFLTDNCSDQTIPGGDLNAAEAAKDSLDDYNNGLIGPGKCLDTAANFPPATIETPNMEIDE